MRTERLLSYICCIGAFILYGCADGGIDDGADEVLWTMRQGMPAE